MFKSLWSIISILLLACFSKSVQANNFAGANSYFLFSLSQPDRIAVLDAMKGADMKLLRIFITRVTAGNKGSSAKAVNDLETVAVGSYDDTILRQIDQLAVEARARNIKLVIAMHDRYALGCWDTDAYVAKYKLPVTGCVNGVPDSTTFYTNANAIADYDNRLRHILNFKSPNFGVPWHQLSDAIFAFEIENEGMGHMNQVAPTGGAVGPTPFGGGTDLPTSLQSQFYSCANIQIIALHDYNLDPSYVASHIDAAKPLAGSSGKRLLYEEFGALGSNKQSQMQAVLKTLISTGVPWMFWELTKPGKRAGDYEVWTDEPTWSTLASQSLLTRKQGGQYGWPEIAGGA